MLPKPENFIKAVRQSFIGSEQVYTQGSCVMFFLILKTVYPKARPYWSKKARHMITKINGKFYDITGTVKFTRDYILDDEIEYSSLPIAVAFPQRTQRRVLLTTPKKF